VKQKAVIEWRKEELLAMPHRAVIDSHVGIRTTKWGRSPLMWMREREQGPNGWNIKRRKGRVFEFKWRDHSASQERSVYGEGRFCRRGGAISKYHSAGGDHTGKRLRSPRTRREIKVKNG